MSAKTLFPAEPALGCPASIDSVFAWKQVQLLMTEALFRPLTRSDGMQPFWRDGRSTAGVVEGFISPNDRMSAFERLEIYNRQYWFRLLDCLHEDYPGLRCLLGESRFHSLCRDYLEQHPSESWTLRNLGGRMVTFLEASPRWAPSLRAKAVDVARIEWAHTLAFDEAAQPKINEDTLLGADPEKLKLGLQPYLVLLELDHAVDSFLHRVRSQDVGLRTASSNAVWEPPPLEVKVRRRPALRREKVWLAVHRYDNAIYYKRLDQESYVVLSRLRAGQPLAGAVETALRDADPKRDWAHRIQEHFATWTELGWLCDARPVPRC